MEIEFNSKILDISTQMENIVKEYENTTLDAKNIPYYIKKFMNLKKQVQEFKLNIPSEYIFELNTLNELSEQIEFYLRQVKILYMFL